MVHNTAMLKFRQAKKEDLEELWSLFLKTREKMESDGNRLWSTGYPPKEYFASDIANGLQYLAYEDGVLVGAFALCYDALDYFYCLSHNQEKLDALLGRFPNYDKKNHPVLIERFMVDPSYQHKGYGAKLLAHLKSVAPNHLYIAITAIDKPTIDFYLHLGFLDLGNIMGEDWGYDPDHPGFEFLASL